jgi:hypothetical protein
MRLILFFLLLAPLAKQAVFSTDNKLSLSPMSDEDRELLKEKFNDNAGLQNIFEDIKNVLRKNNIKRYGTLELVAFGLALSQLPLPSDIWCYILFEDFVISFKSATTIFETNKVCKAILKPGKASYRFLKNVGSFSFCPDDTDFLSKETSEQLAKKLRSLKRLRVIVTNGPRAETEFKKALMLNGFTTVDCRFWTKDHNYKRLRWYFSRHKLPKEGFLSSMDDWSIEL